MLRAGGSSFGKSGGNNDVKDRVFFFAFVSNTKTDETPLKCVYTFLLSLL